MPVIAKFGGLVPRFADHLLEDGQASVAHNVKLRSGKISSWREKLYLEPVEPGAVSFGMFGCCPVEWDSCVQYTNYMPCNRMYLTGRRGKPEVAIFDGCQPTYQYLGVPAPEQPPVIAGSESFGETSAARSYIYTYVNNQGEEGGPSPASNALTVADGSSVQVSFSAPPDGYGIIAVNIYRLATGLRLGDEKEQQMLSAYMLVSTVPLGTSLSFTDNVKETHLGFNCPTREYRVPPAELSSLAHVTGTGVLVGASGNMVHFTRNMQPWNWPAEYDLELPFNIVHIGIQGPYVFISTDGNPFVINGLEGIEARTMRNPIDAGTPLPDIGCGYACSFCMTPFGMVYASVDGLALLKRDASFDILTASWYSTDEWRRMRPDTVRLAYWRGYIFCVTDTDSFMLEVNATQYGDYELGVLTTISDKPTHMMVSENGELLMLEDGAIHQWDAGTARRPYEWVSKKMSWQAKASPTAAKVRAKGTTFHLLTEWRDAYYEKFVTGEEPFRLPRIGRHLFYRVGFSGVGDVEFAEVGTAEVSVNTGK